MNFLEVEVIKLLVVVVEEEFEMVCVVEVVMYCWSWYVKVFVFLGKLVVVDVVVGDVICGFVGGIDVFMERFMVVFWIEIVFDVEMVGLVDWFVVGK